MGDLKSGLKAGVLSGVIFGPIFDLLIFPYIWAVGIGVQFPPFPSPKDLPNNKLRGQNFIDFLRDQFEKSVTSET